MRRAPACRAPRRSWPSSYTPDCSGLRRNHALRAEQRLERLGHDWLDDVGIETGSARALAHGAVRVAGKGHQPRVKPWRFYHYQAQEPRQLATVNLGQANVDQREIRSLVPCSRDGLSGIGCWYCAMAKGRNQLAQHLARVVVVFDDEHAAWLLAVQRLGLIGHFSKSMRAGALARVLSFRGFLPRACVS